MIREKDQFGLIRAFAAHPVRIRYAFWGSGLLYGKAYNPKLKRWVLVCRMKVLDYGYLSHTTYIKTGIWVVVSTHKKHDINFPPEVYLSHAPTNHIFPR